MDVALQLQKIGPGTNLGTLTDWIPASIVPICRLKGIYMRLHYGVFCCRSALNHYYACANLNSFKCDEEQPSCRNCSKSKRECLGYDPIFKSQRSTPLLPSISISNSLPTSSASATSLHLGTFPTSGSPSITFSYTSNSPSPSSGQMEYSGTASGDHAIPSLPHIQGQPEQAQLERPVAENHPQSVPPISKILLHPGTRSAEYS